MSNDSIDTNSTSEPLDPWSQLNVPYTICEVLVAVAAVIGNAIVIAVFGKEKKLRRRTKYYIISLAVADFLVGLLGIPFAILASVGLPRDFYLCLFTVSLLVVLCTISIFCLVAVSIDRYWAILYPLSYSRNVRSRTAIGIIIACWLAGALVGFLPLLGWNEGAEDNQKCLFVEVMDYNYLVFLYFFTIIAPALLLAAFYTHIYTVILKQLRQIVMLSPGSLDDPQSASPARSSGVMLRVLGAAQKREVRATQNLSIIVLFFIICWIPLYTINCVKAFCPGCQVSSTLTNSCIILSHLNSSFNPFLYAYHLKDFRAALHKLIFKSTEQLNTVNPPFIKYDSTLQLPRTEPGITQNASLNSSRSSIAREVIRNSSPNRKVNGVTQENHLWTLTELPSTSEDEGRAAAKFFGIDNSMFMYMDENAEDDDDVFVPDCPRTPRTPMSTVLHVLRRSQSIGNVTITLTDKDQKLRSLSESYNGLELSVRKLYHSQATEIG